MLLNASNIIGTVKEPGNCHTGSKQWSISPSTVSPRVVSTSCFRQRNTTAGSLEIICLQAKFPMFSITGWLMPQSLEIYIPPRTLAYEVRYCPCLVNLQIGIKTEKAGKYKCWGQWGYSSVIPHAANFPRLHSGLVAGVGIKLWTCSPWAGVREWCYILKQLGCVKCWFYRADYILFSPHLFFYSRTLWRSVCLTAFIQKY